MKTSFLWGVIFSLLGVFGFTFLTIASSELAVSQAGKILLDVENNGEAWYVSPVTLERYYLGRPDDAFTIMRLMGLGITNANLALIPTEDSSSAGNAQLRKQLAGRILLQVQSNGEAWYVNPVDLKRYYLGRPTDAFQIMREQGLGITPANLATIPDGGIVHDSITNNVPFTAQAPFAEWGDIRQQEGCEEASALMAVAWASGTSFTKEQAKQEILAMSEYQNDRYKSFIDTSAKDTVDRIFDEYLDFTNLRLQYDISVVDIRHELVKGHLVVVPVDGKALQNPYFTGSGPDRHMIVITGFDWSTGDFITHEPGTYRGANYRYTYEIMQNSLRDYVSGTYAPIPPNARTAMIVVEKLY